MPRGTSRTPNIAAKVKKPLQLRCFVWNPPIQSSHPYFSVIIGPEMRITIPDDCRWWLLYLSSSIFRIEHLTFAAAASLLSRQKICPKWERTTNTRTEISKNRRKYIRMHIILCVVVTYILGLRNIHIDATTKMPPSETRYPSTHLLSAKPPTFQQATLDCIKWKGKRERDLFTT